MEDKLKNLRSALDETTFKDGEFTEQDKISTREKIEQYEQGQSFGIFQRFGSLLKPVLSVAVCLLLFMGAVYIVNDQDVEHSEQQLFTADQKKNLQALLPDKEGKLTLLYVSKGDEKERQFSFTNPVEKKTISKNIQMSLEQVNEEFPELNVEKAPTYIFFDTEGVAFRTRDWKETGKFVIDYLKEKTGFPYPLLLSGKEGKYAVLIANYMSNPKFMREVDIGEFVTQASYRPDPDERYPKLYIPHNKPYYIFFDTKGIVLKTGEEDEAEQFLRGLYRSDNHKFSKLLEEQGIANQKVIWVERYDTNYDEAKDAAFIIFKTMDDRVAVGKLHEQNDRWEWVEGSKDVIIPEDGYYNTLPKKNDGAFIYGVYGSDISKVRVNQGENGPKTIQLESGKTFWYREMGILDSIKIYEVDGSVVFSKTDMAKDQQEDQDKSFEKFYQKDDLSVFEDLHMKGSQVEEIHDVLNQLSAENMRGAPFIPGRVPEGTKLKEITTAQNDSIYGPHGPFLVLQFNSFKISLKINRPKGGYQSKGIEIKQVGINREKAEWLQMKNEDQVYYALRLYDEKIITLTSKLKQISYKDLEEVARSLESIK